MTDLLTRLSGATASRDGLIEQLQSAPDYEAAHALCVSAADALTDVLALCREAAGEIERLELGVRASTAEFSRVVGIETSRAVKAEAERDQALTECIRLFKELEHEQVECNKSEDAVDKVMAERDAALARVAALEAALTPSAETKYAYMGEFQFVFATPLGATTPSVPWTCIKKIMSTILARADLSKDKPND